MTNIKPVSIHAHSHGHAGHDHAHDHGQDIASEFAAARPAVPAFSLLRLSVRERLGGASVLSAMLWLAVWWALT